MSSEQQPGSDFSPRRDDSPREDVSKSYGGVIHTYQKYDPRQFPSPTAPPPDVVSPAFEHMLAYGSLRELTEEELARAVKLDPSQIAGLGPSLDALMDMLRERKRKILATYETDRVQKQAGMEFLLAARELRPPGNIAKRFQSAVRDEQLRDLERLWYAVERDRGPFPRQLLQLVQQLGDKYQVDELAAKYTFTGHERLSIERALEVKEELETIDRLLEQLEEAAKNATLGVIDMDALSQFAEPGDMQQLSALHQQIQDYLKEIAERQGLEQSHGQFQLTPKAYRLFQGRLLEEIFSELQPSRTGRHLGPIEGEGAVETPATKEYEFGDSITNMDIPSSFVNAMIRQGSERQTSGEGSEGRGVRLPIRLKAEDIVIHRTRNNPKCATAVLMDMSGSMRYQGLYMHVKRMGLALEGLIRREFPGDWLSFIEVFSFAKLRAAGELVTMMPKPVTLWDPVVRLKADMSDPNISESMVPPHFTNLQHGLALARQMLSAQDTPNRQVILITDGLPTAHFEGKFLYLLYPPSSATERATMREGMLCKQAGITINIFLLPSWSQSHEDVQFAHRLAETTQGRVFFTGGRDLDRYVVWDYVKRKKSIIG